LRKTSKDPIGSFPVLVSVTVRLLAPFAPGNATRVADTIWNEPHWAPDEQGIVVVEVDATVVDSVTVVVVEEMVDAEDVALEYWVVTWVVVAGVELEELVRLDVCDICMEDDWVLVLDVGVKVVVLEFEVTPGIRAPNPSASAKAITTATVAPEAICLLNSDNGVCFDRSRYSPMF